MLTTTDMSWAAEKRLDERYYYSIANIRGRVCDVPPGSKEIGFTSPARDIFLAKECEITKDMEEVDKKFFRLGVFAHEMLHQLYTDFLYMQSAMSRHARKEATVLQTLINVIEDPAIEYNADNAFGGSLLEALRFTILRIYLWSPPIENSGSAWSQFINALIQFGDVGIIKGDFTYPEAYEAFKLIAPEFLEMVADPVSTHRIDAAERWLEATRFLWEDETESDLKDAAKEAETNMGSAPPQGGGRQKSFPEEGKRETEADKNREKTAEQAKGDDAGNSTEEAEEAAMSQNEGSDGESESTGSEEGEESGTENSRPGQADADGTKNIPGSSADGTLGGCSEECGSGTSGTPDSNSGDDDEDEEIVFGSEPVKKAPGKKLGTDIGTDPQEAEDQAQKAITFDPSAAQTVSDEIAKEEKILDKKAREEMLHAKECEALYGHVEVNDEAIQPDKEAEEEYKEICRRYGRDITLLSSSLYKILVQDVDTSVRSLSGRYNEKRALTRSTVKIFDKRREAKNIADIAVMLVIDESGSMYGKKIHTAKETAIIIAETLSRLKIPCYIMGFTADHKGFDAYHEHFVRWKNTPKERTSLAKLEAKANNFDGFSIRHATLILKKKRADHKLMFIISDGLPACNRYIGRGGIEDTSKAIREASHAAGVIGIGIGIGDDDHGQKELFNAMYGRTPFIPVKDPDELKTTLASVLKSVMRKI